MPTETSKALDCTPQGLLYRLCDYTERIAAGLVPPDGAQIRPVCMRVGEQYPFGPVLTSQCSGPLDAVPGEGASNARVFNLDTCHAMIEVFQEAIAEKGLTHFVAPPAIPKTADTTVIAYYARHHDRIPVRGLLAHLTHPSTTGEPIFRFDILGGRADG